MPTVLVIGKDWTLRSLVRAELREHGVEALGMETLDEAARAFAAGTMPSVVVLDASSTDAEVSALGMLAKRAPLVVVASRVEPAGELGFAAAVLYKPVSVGEVVARVEDLLKGRAA